MSTARPWVDTWDEALYGEGGFYRRKEGPGAHFRTAAHASSSGVLGRAVADLGRRCGCTSVLDVGAGRGELLTAVAEADPALRLTAVERAGRPAGLPAAIGWLGRVPASMASTLLVGWELLDVVPCPVLQVDDDGRVREVLVTRDGRERLGGPPSARDLAWCARWWPLAAAPPGSRAEVGRPREELWADLVTRLADGVAVAVDYGHDAGGRPQRGSLTGYRAGRQVAPIPDAGTDLTAHVALDALAAALPTGVDRLTLRTTQQAALRALGVTAVRPSPGLAGTEPRRYLSLLAAASEAAELLDGEGLGGFGWVVHAVGRRSVEGVRTALAPRADSTPDLRS